METRIAAVEDIALLSKYDRHIRENELCSLVSLGRVLIVEDNGDLIGWLRWSLFWDNTPMMNMLYLLKGHRNKGYGRGLVTYWENLMKNHGYHLVMTSTLSNEEAQHFYRKLNYIDSGSLLLKNQPLEIIFTKEI